MIKIGRFIDLTGQKFGNLTVVSKVESNSNCLLWNCLCDCGNTTIVQGGNLKSGHTQSCGCLKRDSPKNLDDLTDMRFGKLVVLKQGEPHRTSGGAYKTTWICKCDCGKETVVIAEKLKKGMTRSCGCLKKENVGNSQDLTGMQFGRLTVIRRLEPEEKKSRQYCWLCKCDCGVYVHGCAYKLKKGLQKSCGCLKNEVKTNIGNVNKKYKYTNKRLYGVYKHMMSRCYDSDVPEYKNYGGRGICVYDKWHDYDKFAEWALLNGYNPGAKHGECTLDRVDVNGNYEPDNCRFITNKEQQANRRDSVRIEYQGETKCASEWARIYNINLSTLIRNYRKGMGLQEIIVKYSRK